MFHVKQMGGTSVIQFFRYRRQLRPLRLLYGAIGATLYVVGFLYGWFR